MFEGTELLGYALFLFLAYVYLPYTFFKFGAERLTDLGRRRDFTQLEEIISAFVPTILLHMMTTVIYFVINWRWGTTYTIDYSVVASMFGSDRGAVSDYIYLGDWFGCIVYLIELWFVGFLNGLWFGGAVRHVAESQPNALMSLDLVHEKKTRKTIPLHWRAAWRLWYPFFHESIVPLFAWEARKPFVRVETTDHRIYYGKFVKYEKTTDGRMDAIRLRAAQLYHLAQPAANAPVMEVLDGSDIGALYLNWSLVSDITLIEPIDGQDLRSERDRKIKAWREGKP